MRALLLLGVVSGAVLVGCGGGGDSGGGDPFGANGPTFSGTVAVGEPLAGVTVQITGGLGQAFAVTDAAGRYSVTLPGTALGARSYFISTVPPAIGASNLPPAYPNLNAVTNRMGGTLNVTPLTTLLFAQLTASGFDLISGTLTDTQISTARQQVAAYLLQRPHRNDGTLTDPVDVSAVTDFINTPFTAAPGNPYDDAIERLAQTFINGESIAGVEQHMLTRNDPAANLLSILSFEVNGTCTVAPGAGPGLPSGPVRITAGPGGAIAVGSYMRTIGAGDSMQVSTNPPGSGQDTWSFIHTTSGDRFELNVQQRSKLSLVTLRRAGGSSGSTVCILSPVFHELGSLVPRVLPLIRLVAQTITNPFFSCTGTSFPGIINSGNFLGIEDSGALRLSGGHVLHLPSLSMSINAAIVSNAGALGTRITSAAFSRTFTGGLDEFSINLLASGAIQQVRFGQQRNSGATSTAICP